MEKLKNIDFIKEFDQHHEIIITSVPIGANSEIHLICGSITCGDCKMNEKCKKDTSTNVIVDNDLKHLYEIYPELAI